MTEYFLQAETFDDLIINAYKKENEIWIGNWWKETNDFIYVVHQDGSTFKICSAFYKLALVGLVPIEVFLVFSEHNGILAFAKEDVAHFSFIKDGIEVVLIGDEPVATYFK